jgi:hypothetical protein
LGRLRAPLAPLDAFRKLRSTPHNHWLKLKARNFRSRGGQPDGLTTRLE